MADNVIARKQGQWKVVSLVPDVCKTPMGAAIPPVPYPVTAELKTATGVANSVRANGNPVGGKCYPLEKSSSVRAEGKLIVRHGDKFWMNGA